MNKKHRSARFAALVAMGCVINNEECRGRVHIHHLRANGGTGFKGPDDETIPLCSRHHLACGGYGTGLHAGIGAWEVRFGSQEYWLGWVNKRLQAEGKLHGESKPELQSRYPEPVI